MQAYALAVSELLPLPEEQGSNVRVTLHFLEPDIEFRLQDTLLSPEVCRSAIDNAMREIVSSLEPHEFPVRPAMHCRMCNFLRICPAGRDWVRSSSARPAAKQSNPQNDTKQHENGFREKTGGVGGGAVLGYMMSKTSNLQVGDAAPDFTLPDGNGDRWSLSAHRGKVVVLLFYPGDETPACIRQMCSVRDRWEDYSSTGAEVVGI